MNRRRLLSLLLVTSCCGLVGSPLTRADRLHLEGGGVIHVSHWWMDGDRLIYENGSGTVGIPRSMVVRIEPTEVVDPEPTPASRARQRPADSGPDESAKRAEALERFRQGREALDRREYEFASSRFLEALDADPRLSQARVGYALSQLAIGHDGLALSVVHEGLALDPDNAHLHELLGDLRDREERVGEALESWKAAFALEPSDRLREKILKAGRELHAGGDFAFSTTSHFNVRYNAAVDRELASAVVDYLEQQYWVLSDLFRHAPPQPITVLLYPTRQFRDVTLSPDSVAGVYDGKIRVPLGGLDRIGPQAQGVLAHELAHAVVFSKTRGNCPRWLHEGLAQLAENRRLDEQELRAVARLLGEGEPADWESRGFSYPAALSLTRYLETRRGIDGLADLLDHLARGEKLDDALERVYGEDHAVLCRRWARELER